MTNIFSKISKINKQKVDKIESELFLLKSAIRQIEEKIKSIYTDVDKLEIPKSGDVSLLFIFQEQRKVLNKQKNRLSKKLHTKNLELANKHEEYKKARIEFEKIKYLEEQEIAKKIEKLKKEEQKNLDEISNMLYRGVVN
ncbi:MAG: FliJ family protein [Epsilonproteobacteria bacterium]|nr:FliJ family protein [Campylobacterota bacterium]